MLLGIFIVFALLSFLVSQNLKRKVAEYSQTRLSMSGAEIAERMLRDNGIYDVKIVSIDGTLTDHYNPTNRTINLSHDVFEGRNVAAASVAAHETGHALQHADAYAPLQLRSALVPLQNASAKVINIMFIAMFVGAMALPHIISYDLALTVIVACYGVFTLFAFVTLPVEINASTRAIAWLTNRNLIEGETRQMACSALRSAAYTYVVAALSALATLLYYLLMLVGRSDD